MYLTLRYHFEVPSGEDLTLAKTLVCIGEKRANQILGDAHVTMVPHFGTSLSNLVPHVPHFEVPF